MTTSTVSTPALPQNEDQRLIHGDISWSQFKLIQAGFAKSSGVRLCFANNILEILMPGREHELFKSIIGMLIELFCLDHDIEFEPTGSATQEDAEQAVAAEPDESYCFGASKPVPDLVVEVIFSSGGPDKLQRYEALKIPEVWFWQDGVLTVYHLRNRGYEQLERSELPELAELDIKLLSHCILMGQTSRLEAARTFRTGWQP